MMAISGLEMRSIELLVTLMYHFLIRSSMQGVELDWLDKNSEISAYI
jgi:hypothetical protein